MLQTLDGESNLFVTTFGRPLSTADQCMRSSKISSVKFICLSIVICFQDCDFYPAVIQLLKAVIIIVNTGLDCMVSAKLS